MVERKQPFDADKPSSVELRLQEIIVGREKEIEAIKMQFDAVLEGNTAFTLIAGDVGCGKTALVKAVLADLASSRPLAPMVSSNRSLVPSPILPSRK